VGDLEKALASLDGYPVAFDVSQLETVEGTDNLIEEVDRSSAHFIYDETNSLGVTPNTYSFSTKHVHHLKNLKSYRTIGPYVPPITGLLKKTFVEDY
jgi:hypothetical protein